MTSSVLCTEQVRPTARVHHQAKVHQLDGPDAEGVVRVARV